MLMISVNGIIQLPNLDYTASGREIQFTMAPPMGSVVEIRSKGAVIRETGTGFIKTFWVDQILDDDPMLALFEDAYRNRDNPTVIDLLEKLQVVVNLIKSEA